jgi:hypothetical protein
MTPANNESRIDDGITLCYKVGDLCATKYGDTLCRTSHLGSMIDKLRFSRC